MQWDVKTPRKVTLFVLKVSSFILGKVSQQDAEDQCLSACKILAIKFSAGEPAEITIWGCWRRGCRFLQFFSSVIRSSVLNFSQISSEAEIIGELKIPEHRVNRDTADICN